MEAVTRNVRDLDESDRSVMERVFGRQLRETQTIVLNLVNIDWNIPNPVSSCPMPDVPDYWKIYDGLSDEEIDKLDGEIRQRANLTRHFE